jgi:hypothetical protein
MLLLKSDRSAPFILMEAFELAQKNGQALFSSSIFIIYSEAPTLGILNGTRKRKSKRALQQTSGTKDSRVIATGMPGHLSPRA